MSTLTVPVTIPFRPFAICSQTNMMNTDGFFIVNIGNQIIQTSIVNESNTTLKNVRVYIEGISDPGIPLPTSFDYVGDVPPNASFSVRFITSFIAANPGIANISFIIESDGFSFNRIIKKIFITRIDYHKPTKTYSVVMPEGSMKINIHNAIVGLGEKDPCNPEKTKPFIVLPTDVTYDWVPNPPYEGIRGPFPYNDPWWKIALGILAGAFALGALLYDYFSDGELDGGVVSVKGTFEETTPSVCCPSVTTSATNTDDWFERGLYSAVGAIATAAIASDGPDLHYRGQEQTPPVSGELTISESVRLNINYPVAPSPGRDYPIEGDWEYTRTTTNKTYTFNTSDQRQNIHFLNSYEVKSPNIHHRGDPLKICASFEKSDGSYYSGNELYVNAVLISTQGEVLRFELCDNGIGLDEKANDNLYCGGSYNEEELQPGNWYLFVFAQDVNTVKEGTPPFDAAHTIGGFLLTSQLELNFNGPPCELNHDSVIKVV